MATKKAASKKVAPKKAAAKKVVAKKPVAKKPASAKKPAPAKKAPAKKAAPKKAEPEVRRVNGRKLKPGKRVKPVFKRVPPKIVKRPSSSAKPVVQPAVDPAVEAAKAVSLAQSIALALKRNAAASEQKSREAEIRLARRPTTRAQGKDTVKFPASDLKEFRKRLLEAREAALTGVNAMKATGFNESDDHEADGGDGTNQTLRLQALGQMGQINRTIQKIEEALHRIDDGTYGVCTMCGQLIRKPRLLNQPFVLTCMECQSEMERSGTR